jgi:hypothetical protein
MDTRIPSRSLPALGLLSAAVIACQLALMQMLAIVQWNHFAYMVISLAMLGFGAAGTTIALFRKKLLQHLDALLPLFAILSGLGMIIVAYLANHAALSFDLYHLFVDRSQFWKLAVSMLLYFTPFFMAALVIGLYFTAYTQHIGKLYFANLSGSGVGGMLALLLLSLIHPAVVFGICATLTILSGIMMKQKRSTIFSIFSMIAFSFAALSAGFLPSLINPSQYKSLSRIMNMPDTKIILTKRGIHGLLQVAESPFMRYAPGISLSYTSSIPVKPAVFINGDFAGVLPRMTFGDIHPSAFTTFHLPYRMKTPESLLVINAGTGTMVAHALRQGVQRIDVVEPNKNLINLMRGQLSAHSDSLYWNESIEIHTMEAGSFFSLPGNNYDLIVLPVFESFGGTSGLFATQENYTITTERVSEMWQRLKPDGLIAVSSWIDYPVRTPLKITSTLMEMLRKNGIETPEAHLAAIKSWGTITFVVSRQPFTDDQTAKIRSFCEEMFFDPVLLRGIRESERNHYNVFSDTSFFSMIDVIVAGETETLFADYPFFIEPASDNRPYFNQFLRMRSIKELSGFFGSHEIPFLELGYLIVLITLIQVSLLAVLLIILPLIHIRTSSKRKTPVLIYFATLGLGYMLIEIILIQQFIHYFGTTVEAAAFVISVMMIASGAGSVVAARSERSSSDFVKVLGMVAICILLLTLTLAPLLCATAAYAFGLKYLIGFCAIAIPAFFMGMPFPMGLRYLHKHHQLLVPWAWGINGCLSVIASSLAILVAIEFGFRTVMMLGGIVYVIALIVAGIFFRQNEQSVSDN